MNPIVSTLIDGLRVTLLRRPRGYALNAGAGVFVALTAFYLAAMLGMEMSDTPRPWHLVPAGVTTVLTDSVLTLIAAWALTALSRRTAIVWSVASILLAATIATALIVHWPLNGLSSHLFERGHALPALGLELVSRGWWLLILLVFSHWIAPRNLPRTLGAALVAYAISAASWWWLPTMPLLVTAPDSAQMVDGIDADAPDVSEEAETFLAQAPDFDPEAIMYEQSALLDAELGRLAPQRPGTVDLYVIAFAGDAVENVFRNEVEHIERLFAQRFDADGHVVVLANNAQAPAAHPLASWTSLHRAVGAIANTMDPAEDILLVYLTTHGSEDHELLVDLEPLPLNQIAPLDLADALNTAPGIRWKVVVVNACYSGGFIDALRDDSTLVMTSARADRTSFGCGSESDITYFGKAFLAEALNQTTSLREAFDLAAKSVNTWEAADQQEHSEPQIASSPSIEAKLTKWSEKLPQRPAVPFVPATETPSSPD